MRDGQLPEHPTKAAVSVDALIRSKLMKLPFSRRNAELENMNRILTDAARKKAERIKEVEDQVAQLERQVAHLKQALESARKRESELEVAATQRAHLLNEKDKEIAALREVLTQRAPLAGLREVACTRFRRHRVRCFDGAGGGSWRDGSLRGSSSLRLCA